MYTDTIGDEYIESILLISTIMTISSIYVLNNIFDYDLDKNAGCSQQFFNFISPNKLFIPSVIVGLFGVFILIFINIYALLLGTIGFLIGFIYSAPPIRCKTRPPFDSILHLIGYGIIMFQIGWVAKLPMTYSSLLYGTIIGLFFLNGQILLTLFDRDSDQKYGIKTIATIFSTKKSFYLAFSFYLLSLILSYIFLPNKIFTIFISPYLIIYIYISIYKKLYYIFIPSIFFSWHYSMLWFFFLKTNSMLVDIAFIIVNFIGFILLFDIFLIKKHKKIIEVFPKELRGYFNISEQ